MISHNDKSKVLNILQEHMGAPDKGKGDEYVYHCPFCNHHKKKMNVNIETQKYHCWVCDTKGKKISSLLWKLGAEKQYINTIKKIYEDGYYDKDEITEDTPKILFLPREYISLISEQPKNPHYRNAIKYLSNRGILKNDIIKYNIGYCEKGQYMNRIIIPSYNKDNILNYFIARSFYENEKYAYKNPPISKNVVALENQINWNLPIVLVEGIFDAIAVRRNAIPLFGKFIPKKLIEAIFRNGVKTIYIMLDEDAQKQALYYVELFNKQDIQVINIPPRKKDPSDMGFDENIDLIKNTKPTTYKDIITQKLNLI